MNRMNKLGARRKVGEFSRRADERSDCRNENKSVTLCFSVCRSSHLHAGAGWTGVGAVSNGAMVEPGQGVNGAVLTNTAGMSTAGYHTH